MNIEQCEVIKVRKYKAGYEIRTVIVPADVSGTGEPMEMKQAFTPTGDWIGPSSLAHRLIVTMGIKPEKISPKYNACSIGFSEKRQKWYGWSHRAIFGYDVGHIAKAGDITVGSYYAGNWPTIERPDDYYYVPVGFQAKTLEDCKHLAKVFAQAVAR